MKHQILLLVLILCFSQSSFSQAPGWQWAASDTARQYDQSSAVTTDRSGNVYVAGYFAGDSMVFGAQVVYNNTSGFDDVFIAKYDSAGVFQWVRAIGGNDDDKAFAIGTDTAGNVYVTGSFYSDSLLLGNDTLVNAGNVGDIFIAKYDASGNILKSWREGGPGVEIPYAIYVEPNGGLVVAGRFSSLSITFGAFTLTQAGSMDVFVVRYDPTGHILWAKGAGSGSNDEAYGIDEDAQGNVYVAGYFNGNCSFGTVTLTSAGSSDIFLAKYDATGNLGWAKRAGGNGDDRAQGVKTEGIHCYLAGFFQSASAAFGTITLNNFLSSGDDNAFIAAYDSSGTATWADALDGRSRAEGVAASNGYIYACGVFRNDTLHVGSSSILLDGSTDLFVACVNTAGVEQWAMKNSSGGSGSEFANAIACDASGKVVTAGDFDSNVIGFGTSSLGNSFSGFDMFVARLATTPVGIIEPEAITFSVFPNPATDEIRMQLPGTGWEVSLFDMQGKRVYSIAGGSEKYEINTRHLPKGVYLLRAVKGEQVLTKTLVVD